MASNNFFLRLGLNVNNVFFANGTIINYGNTNITQISLATGNSTANVTINQSNVFVGNNSSNVIIANTGVTSPLYSGAGVMANASQYWSNAAGIVVTTGQLNNAGIYTTILDQASPVWDTANGINFIWTLGANRTLPNPATFPVGRSGVLQVKENGTGGFTLSFGNCFIFDSDTAPVIGTAANKSNFLFYHFVSSANCLITMAAKSVTF